jgi:RimJ/RimL family protein N-acetyltransferase
MFDHPGFRTPRLRLRALRLSDLDAYAAMCADEEVMRYIGAGGPVSREMAWRHLAMFLGTWALHGHGMWAVERRSDGQMIGRVGFIDPPDWPGCELGWLLAREAWGQGFAFEAASAALAFGRQQQGLGELISLIRPDNAPSIRLAERLGARNTGPIDFMGSQALLFRHAPP